MSDEEDIAAIVTRLKPSAMTSGVVLAGLGISSLIGPFLVPTNLIPFVPLISATFAMQWAIDEWHFLSSWVKLSSQAKSSLTQLAPHHLPRLRSGKQSGTSETKRNVLAEWFGIWKPQGGLIGASAYPICYVSIFITLHNIWSESWSIKGWYVAGVALFIYHIPFGNQGFKRFTRIEHEEKYADSLEHLDVWLTMHRKRTLFIDVPGWICFVVATIQVLDV